MEAKLIWERLFSAENFELVAILVNEKLQTAFRLILEVEGVEQGAGIHLESLAAPLGIQGLLHGLKAARLHVVHQKVLFFICAARLLEGCDNGLNRAVVDVKHVGDKSLSHLVHLAIVDHVEPIRVADVLVYRLGCGGGCFGSFFQLCVMSGRRKKHVLSVKLQFRPILAIVLSLGFSLLLLDLDIWLYQFFEVLDGDICIDFCHIRRIFVI